MGLGAHRTVSEVQNLRTVEIKAFVPARDLELSKRFYAALGFAIPWSSEEMAYVHYGDTSFLLQAFFVPEHANNFQMHLLVENVDDWWRHVKSRRVAEEFGVEVGTPEDRPWAMRDFTLFDPSGVLWRVAQNIERRPSPRRNAMETATRTVQVNDARLAYRDAGTGQPVLFVHGAVSDHRVWKPQWDALESRYRCIAVDMRCFGMSSGGDRSGFTLETHANDLCAFIEAVGSGPMHLVGHSYGSVVALAATVARPDLVADLFLSEPTLASAVTEADDVAVLHAARAELGPVVEALSKGDTRAAVESFFDWTVSPGAFASLPLDLRDTIIENARTLGPFLSAPPPRIRESDLAGIKVRTSLTVGDKTRPFFAAQVRGLQRLLPHSSLTTISGYHGSIFVDATEFNRALVGHLDERHAADA